MLWDSFHTYLIHEKAYSSHTVKAYKTDLKSLDSFLQEIVGLSLFKAEDLVSVHHRLLRDWMAALMDQGLSSRSVARKISAAKSYFQFCYKSEHISSNPALRVKVPKFEKKLPSFLKENEVTHLLDQLTFPDTFEGKRDKCILEILYGCGLRSSEMISLRKQDVDLHSQMLSVQGKGNKERRIPFGTHVKQSVQAYLLACEAEEIQLRDTFFVRRNGKAMYPGLLYKLVQGYLGQVSSLNQRSPHVLRHTYATHLLDNGADLNAIKELLGHSSLAATQVYTHNTIAKLQSVHKQAHPRAENRET